MSEHNGASEVKPTKAELFKENPDNFIHRKDLVVGIVRTEKGPAMCFDIRTREEMMRSLGELQTALIGQALKHGVMSDMSKIIKPGAPRPGGIMNFVRGRR